MATPGAATTAAASQHAGSTSYDHLFKIIIVGDEAVGKTCLLLQFTDKRYRLSHQVTVGVEFGARTIAIRPHAAHPHIAHNVKLQIWDTAGQDRFRSIVRSYYRGAAGALIVYDITSRASFDHVAQWLDETQQHTADNLAVVIVGNKADLEGQRQVSTEEGAAFAKARGFMFAETSAVTGSEVDATFTRLAEAVWLASETEEIDVLAGSPSPHAPQVPVLGQQERHSLHPAQQQIPAQLQQSHQQTGGHAWHPAQVAGQSGFATGGGGFVGASDLAPGDGVARFGGRIGGAAGAFGAPPTMHQGAGLVVTGTQPHRDDDDDDDGGCC